MRAITKLRLPFYGFMCFVLISALLPWKGGDELPAIAVLFAADVAVGVWVSRRVRCPQCDVLISEQDRFLPDRCARCDADFHAPPPPAPLHAPHPWLVTPRWPHVTTYAVVCRIVELVSVAAVLFPVFDPQHRWWISVAVNAVLLPVVFYLRSKNPAKARSDESGATGPS